MAWRRSSRAAEAPRPGTGRPSPALVVASLALVVALGGTSYAALALPAASVGTPQLRGGAVTTAKLAARAVTSAKLARGAVTSASLARDAVRNANVRAGAGVSIVYRSGGAQIAANSQRAVYTACPPGTNAVGGGETPDDPLHVFLVYTAPFDRRAKSNSGPADSWVADVVNTDRTRVHNFSVYATCITAGRCAERPQRPVALLQSFAVTVSSSSAKRRRAASRRVGMCSLGTPSAGAW